MSRRDTIIGLIVLVLLGVLFYRFYVRNFTSDNAPTPVPTPTFESRLEEEFNITIPDDAQRLTLRDVTGGDATAIATRRQEIGTFEHTVIADLPDPREGTFYQGWLVRGKEGDPDYAFISTGRFSMAKGGYVLEFKSSTDYSDYRGVVVTLERVSDNNPEEHVLEGSF